MKRFLAGSAALFLLSACTEKSVLPSADVMQRAALKAGLLQSVEFEGSGELTAALPAAAGTLGAGFHFAGSMQDTGQMTHVRLTLEGKVGGDTDHPIAFDGEMTAERGGSTYFLIHRVSGDAGSSLLPLGALAPFTGQWWKLPVAEGQSSASVTPDPGLLTVQSKVITVTADNGIHRIRGQRAYLYDIAIDPVRFLDYLKTVALARGEPFDEAAMKTDLQTYAATGKLWIDADTFRMHRVEWVIVRTQEDKETLTADIGIDFTAHDAALPIEIPASARVFNASGFALPSGTSGLSLPAPAGSDDPTLLDIMQRQVHSSSVSP